MANLLQTFHTAVWPGDGQSVKFVPPTPEHNSHTGVKILNLDFMGFSDILGWAWPELIGSSKFGFSDGLGQVLKLFKH